jgi:phosphoglycolate phosphatase-like HAD superfamily hydrolase
MDWQTPIDGAIFDVDGTLIDSVDLHAKAWGEALRDYGHAVPFDQVRKQIGKGGDQLMPVFLSRQELAAYGKDLDAHRGRLFKERYLQLVTRFPGVRDLFQRLIADGRQVALASSAKEDELQLTRRSPISTTSSTPRPRRTTRTKANPIRIFSRRRSSGFPTSIPPARS